MSTIDAHISLLYVKRVFENSRAQGQESLDQQPIYF